MQILYVFFCKLTIFIITFIIIISLNSEVFMKQKLLISTSLLLIALGMFFYIDRKKVRQKSNTLVFSWDHYRKDTLTTIISTIYRGNNERAFSLQKENGEWFLKSPLELTIFPEKALALANSFLTLRPQEVYSNVTDETKSSYGLNTPQFKIIGLFAGETNGFLIGDKTTVGEQFYISDLNDTNLVYLVDKEQLAPFMTGVSTFVNNYFLTKSTDEIVYVSFYNREKINIVLTNSNRFWVQTAPTSNNHVDWGTRKFLLRLKDLSFNAKMLKFDTSEENLMKLGINKESLQMHLIFEDNSTNSLLVGEAKEGVYPLYISAENIIVFAKTDDVDTIFNTTLNDFKNRTNR